MIKGIAKVHLTFSVVTIIICSCYSLFSKKVDTNGEGFISLPSFEKNSFVGKLNLNGCFIYDIEKPSWDSIYNINVSFNPLSYDKFTSLCLESSKFFIGKEKIVSEDEDKNTGEIIRNVTYKYYFNVNKNPYYCLVDETLYQSNSNLRCVKFIPYYYDENVQKVVVTPFLNLSYNKNDNAKNIEYVNESNHLVIKYDLDYTSLVISGPNIICNNMNDLKNIFSNYLYSKYYSYDNNSNTFIIYPYILDVGISQSKSYEVKCFEEKMEIKEFVYDYK